MDTSRRTVVVGHFEGMPDIRSYSTRRELSQAPTAFDFTFPFSFDEYSAAVEQIGSLGTGLLLGIRDVKGLEFGQLTRYTLELAIGLAYEWEEVEPAVLATFEDILGGAGEIRRVMIDAFDSAGGTSALIGSVIASDAEADDLGAVEGIGRPCWPDYDYLEEDQRQPSHVVVRNYTHPEPPE